LPLTFPGPAVCHLFDPSCCPFPQATYQLQWPVTNPKRLAPRYVSLSEAEAGELLRLAATQQHSWPGRSTCLARAWLCWRVPSPAGMRDGAPVLPPPPQPLAMAPATPTSG
jgi:hypothetical protein